MGKTCFHVSASGPAGSGLPLGAARRPAQAPNTHAKTHDIRHFIAILPFS